MASNSSAERAWTKPAECTTACTPRVAAAGAAAIVEVSVHQLRRRRADARCWSFAPSSARGGRFATAARPDDRSGKPLPPVTRMFILRPSESDIAEPVASQRVLPAADVGDEQLLDRPRRRAHHDVYGAARGHRFGRGDRAQTGRLRRRSYLRLFGRVAHGVDAHIVRVGRRLLAVGTTRSSRSPQTACHRPGLRR